MKKFINPLLSLGTAAALLGAIYFQNQEIDSLKKQTPIQNMVGSNNQNIVDSLQEEIFMLQSQNGRYELSLEHLYEVNPKAGKEFQNFMEHETE
jgi:hypothetical protein